MIFNTQIEKQDGNLNYMLVEEADILPSLMTRLYESGIQSVLVEGGQFLLQSLIDAGLWDEVRIPPTNHCLYPKVLNHRY